MRTLVTGATGFIGRRLVSALSDVVVLSRNPAAARAALGNVEAFGWDAQAAPPPEASLRDVDVVFHLAGESVGEGRWSRRKKQQILDSRVRGTRHLVEGLARASRPPRVLISASAIGYYGDRGDEVLTEQSAAGNDFLAEVCRAWEAEAQRASEQGIRVVALRLGVVLGPRGGALARMWPIFRWGAGGRLGSGRQWMSWIHVDDVVGLARFAAEQESLSGPVNAVAPGAVINREFTQELGIALHRPTWFPAPRLGLRLALGEFAEVLLSSQRVMPAVAERAGYPFRFARLPEALASCVSGG